ncbi:unnamed protein product, partial [Ectocarpus sp. 4 AP-2014]
VPLSAGVQPGYLRATVCSHPYRGRHHEEPHRAHDQEEIYARRPTPRSARFFSGERPQERPQGGRT